MRCVLMHRHSSFSGISENIENTSIKKKKKCQGFAACTGTHTHQRNTFVVYLHPYGDSFLFFLQCTLWKVSPSFFADLFFFFYRHFLEEFTAERPRFSAFMFMCTGRLHFVCIYSKCL